MSALEWANAVARFALEICALAVLGYWGFWVTDIVVVELVLAILVPAVFALTWAGLVAPKAPFRLEDPARLTLEAAMFTAAGLALVSLGRAMLGVVFIVAAVINIVLMVLLDQRRPYRF